MSSIPKAVESRGRFLERIEGGAAETSVDERLVALTAPMGCGTCGRSGARPSRAASSSP